ncbi:MAG: hypothetical protein UZ12_BCD005001063 [Bacteroidetes bacterium OLB12]|nr:MAG: hypothetical protein UZ12_BCD005001063 [Bacteroidetes bacterium OLB12]
MSYHNFKCIAWVLLLVLLMSAASVDVKSRCENPLGSYLHTKPLNLNYNCYQYTRTALLHNNVNLSSGFPSNEGNFPGYTVSTIIGDQNFIKVCSLSQAMAVAFLEAGHAAIKLCKLQSYVYIL